MDKKNQPNSAATRKPAPTRAQIKNRILKDSLATLLTAFIPKGGSEKVVEKEERISTTTSTVKKPGHGGRGKGRGSSAAVAAAAALTPSSGCYASDGDSNS